MSTRHRIAAIVLAALSVIGGISATATAAGAAAPPAQPAGGPGGADYKHSGMRVDSGGFGDNAWYVFSPTGPVPASAPLTIITHGYDEYSGYAQMETLIRHTVRQGSVVVYPRWQVCFLCPLPNMEFPLNAAVKGIKDGLAWLRANPAVPRPQLDRATYFGFSYGGMITVNMTNRHVALGLPFPHAIVLDEPTGGPVGDQFDTTLTGIPATTRLTCLISQWYAENQPTNGCYSFWDRIGHIPPSRKDFIVVHPDDHGTPPLVAEHGMSSGTTPDPIDHRAIWKAWDAQRACALRATWCDFTNNTPAARDMGTWSDGVPVTQLTIADTPVPA